MVHMPNHDLLSERSSLFSRSGNTAPLNDVRFADDDAGVHYFSLFALEPTDGYGQVQEERQLQENFCLSYLESNNAA